MKRKISLLLSIVMCMSMWVGNINFVKAAEPTLNKDTWTEGTDGKWRKIMHVPGWDFESMSDGEYTPTKDPGVNADTAGHFWNNNQTEYKLFDIETVNAPNKVLKWEASKGPNNIRAKVRIDNKYNYELNYYLPDTSGSIQLQNNASGANAITPVPIESTGGKIPFESSIIPSGILLINIWQSATGKITFDTLELVAVSDKNPDDTSFDGKEKLFADNDIINPKNAGNFELSTIPADDFITTEGVTIVDGGYKGNKSAKITSGKNLTLKIDDRLEANTEYTIYFATKATNTLEFRLSGFKNATKFEYDNGNYNNSDDKTWPEEEKANLYNWLENLKITNKDWKTFRYDFTTSDTSKSVQAKFTAKGGDAHVDTIFIVKKANLNETTYTLPSNDQMSKGHRLLIDNGLQFQSWITTDVWEAEKGWLKVPPVEKIKDMGLTAVQYNDKPNFNKTLHEAMPDLKWATAWGPKYNHISGIYQDSSDGKIGLPTEAEWQNGFLTPENGLDYLENLVSMCIGDEDDYSDTLTQNLKSWFEVIREKYPNVLVHHNEVGNTPQDNMRQISTFNKNMLSKYVQTAKPDLITYDMYYFRERRIDQTVGGTTMGLIDDLNRYRIIANEGHDGTGEQPIPFGHYTYSWRTGPGAASSFKRGDGWYELTQSQLNMYSFAPWTFGAKWMSNFRWLDESSQYLFSDYEVNVDGTTKKYKFYDWFKEMVRQSKNLGPHLTRIVNTDVVVKLGQNKLGKTEPTKNNKPADNEEWTVTNKENQKVFISDVQVKNLGTQNDSLNGDVFISYFDQLKGLTEDDKKVFTSTDPRYFMVLNGLTSGDGLPVELQQGSSWETRQEITLTFANVPAGAKLMKVSRVDGIDPKDATKGNAGKVIEVPVTNNKITTTIGGGYADLYYWELGDKKTTTSLTADETGKDELMMGEPKYENTDIINTRDLGGRTITVGNITGTNDIQPDTRMGANINTPAAADQVDGKVIVLDDYATPGGNIGSIGTRYFTQDIWEFRIADVQKRNNVNLEFKEYNWTKEQLLANIQTVKAGGTVAGGMPDILVVPDNWLWEINGLISNDAVVPMNVTDVIDLTADKWSEAYKQMTTKDGNTYGAFTGLTLNPIGMFVNKTMVNDLNTLGNNTSMQIYQLERQDKWTFTELNALIDKAITNNIASSGKKMFADNDYLLRQLLASCGVTDPYNFDANSEEYKNAMTIYKKLNDNNLLMSGTLDEQMAAFQAKNLVFIVAPYTEVAKHLSTQYFYYEDNSIRKTGLITGPTGWAGVTPQTYTASKDADGKWRATVRIQPAGKYTMVATDWNFMLFPKPTESDNYRAIIHNASVPVILDSTNNANDVAFIYNKLAEKYKGLDETADLFKRGGKDYPEGRFWEGVLPSAIATNARDIDAIRKAGMRDGFGDLFKATGVWDNVLATAIKNGSDATTTNTAVQKFLAGDVLAMPTITTKPVDVTALENNATVLVTLASDTKDAKIYYTTDGTEPTTASSLYTGAFEVKTSNKAGETITIKAIATKENMDNSLIANKKIVFKANIKLETAIKDGNTVLNDPSAKANQIIKSITDLSNAIKDFTNK